MFSCFVLVYVVCMYVLCNVRSTFIDLYYAINTNTIILIRENKKGAYSRACFWGNAGVSGLRIHCYLFACLSLISRVFVLGDNLYLNIFLHEINMCLVGFIINVIKNLFLLFLVYREHKNFTNYLHTN